VDQEIEINSIARIKFLMEYDVRKSPYDNILLEQTTELQKLAREKGFGPVSAEKAEDLYFQGKLGPITEPTSRRDPYNAVLKPLDSKYNTIYDVPQTKQESLSWDHETAGWIELGLTFGGMAVMATGIGVPIGATMVGAGTLVGTIDALKYYQEDRPYMGTIMLALQAIPGGEFISGLAKYSPKVIKNLPELKRILDKLNQNKTLTDFEGKVYDDAVKIIGGYLKKGGAKLFAKESIKRLRLVLSEMELPSLIKFIIKVGKLSGNLVKFLSKIGIKIGRITLTVDYLWTLMQTPDNWWEKTRTKDEFSKTMDMLWKKMLPQEKKDAMWELRNKIYNPDGSPNVQGQQEIKKQLQDSVMYSMENDFYASLLDSTTTAKDDVSIDFLDKWRTITPDSTTQDEVGSPVTIDSILSGKQTIRKGQKGKVVREIQEMLLYLGYDLGESGKNKSGVDGDFGDSTQKAVIEFQEKNKLKDTSGIVGKDTLSLIKKQYEE
jgi:hypothetical protein